MNSYDRTDFEMLKSVDIKNVDKGSLIDLDVVQIDDTRPVSERILSFLQQVKNPYCFRIGDIAVNEMSPNFDKLLSRRHKIILRFIKQFQLGLAALQQFGITDNIICFRQHQLFIFRIQSQPVIVKNN